MRYSTARLVSRIGRCVNNNKQRENKEEKDKPSGTHVPIIFNFQQEMHGISTCTCERGEERVGGIGREGGKYLWPRKGEETGQLAAPGGGEVDRGRAQKGLPARHPLLDGEAGRKGPVAGVEGRLLVVVIRHL